MRMYLGDKVELMQDKYKKNPHLRLKIDQNGYIDFGVYDKLTNIWKILED